MNEPRATIDVETRSAYSLKKGGSWRYSLDPSTQLLCLGIRLPYWPEGKVAVYHPAFPHLGIDEAEVWDELGELFDWIESGGLVEAHNAWMERGVWNNILVPKGWPVIKWNQWRCSAAKAAAYALPRALEDAVEALQLPIRKDIEGGKVMKKITKPRKPNQTDKRDWARRHAPCGVCSGTGKIQGYKKDGSPKAKLSKCDACAGKGHTLGEDLSSLPPLPVLYYESEEWYRTLFAYNGIDVLAEEGISDRLPDPNDLETTYYLLDQRANERGFYIDREALDTALRIIEEQSVELNQELFLLTGGQVEKATQRDRMKEWLETQGLVLEDTKADTLDDILDGDYAESEDDKETPWEKVVTGPARRAIELMRALGRSSTAKYVKMRDWLCPDSRIHGGLLFHGASTGRWSGAGVQPHNFPKGTIGNDKPFDGKKSGFDMEKMWERLKSWTTQQVEEYYGVSIMEVLSNALRGAITASPGKQLYVADFASIEARVLLWLAQDTDALKVFHEGKDIYCEMAQAIYNRPCHKSTTPSDRALGKVAVLGLGYQMGWAKFIETAFNSPDSIVIDEDMARRVVDAYRTKFWRVKKLWQEMEDAAIAAVANPHRSFRVSYVEWFMGEGFLHCRLPSGRLLSYPSPELREQVTPWGETRLQLTYKGINQFNRKWMRQPSYGGLLVENIVQAIARDLMAAGMLAAEEAGYLVILTVHDELISERDAGTGDVKEFERLMATVPAWGKGCPVEAEGWTGFRYRK